MINTRELQDGPLAYKVLMVYAACFIIALPILGFLGFLGRSQNNDESHQVPSQEASVWLLLVFSFDVLKLEFLNFDALNEMCLCVHACLISVWQGFAVPSSGSQPNYRSFGVSGSLGTSSTDTWATVPTTWLAQCFTVFPWSSVRSLSKPNLFFCHMPHINHIICRYM